LPGATQRRVLMTSVPWLVIHANVRGFRQSEQPWGNAYANSADLRQIPGLETGSRCVLRLLCLVAGENNAAGLPSAELAHNSRQDLSPDLDFATLDIGQIGLADASAISKLLLSHVNPARFPYVAAQHPSNQPLPISICVSDLHF